MRTIALVFAAAAAAAASPAAAVTLYDQGPPLQVSGLRADLWSADDFTVSTNSLLSGATVYLRYAEPNIRIGIDYALYADNAGRPGAILLTGSATPTVTPLAAVNADGPTDVWTFNFASPTLALANTRYWLGVSQGSDRQAFATVSDGGPAGRPLISFAGSNPSGYQDFGSRGLAFSIQGTAVAVTPGVPEPATWALLIAGFGGIGVAMRRRRVAVRFA